IYKQFYGPSWQRGLVTISEVWSAGVRQKWTNTYYDQDNTSVSYPTNPRVTEINIYDAPPANNRRRTTISYGSVTVGPTVIHLPETVRAYGATNSDEVWRRTVTFYMWTSVMTDRRVIGMPWRHAIYEGESTLRSMEEYIYDWLNNVQNTAPSVHHDTNNY